MTSPKITIIVKAGLYPDKPEPEFTMRFDVSHEQYYSNEGVKKVYEFAQEYMRMLWNPARVNWVRCEWVYQ